MKKLFFAAIWLMVLVGLDLQAQLFTIKQPNDWLSLKNQIQLNLQASNQQAIKQITCQARITLSGDGIIDEMLNRDKDGDAEGVRFPSREPGQFETNDPTKWSFVDIIKDDNPKDQLYQLTMRIDNFNDQTHWFLPGNNWVLAEMFFLFLEMPTKGKLRIEMSKVQVDFGEGYKAEKDFFFEHNFGEEPKPKAWLYLTDPLFINSDVKILSLDLWVKPENANFAGAIFDLKVSSAMILDTLAFPPDLKWVGSYNVISSNKTETIYRIILVAKSSKSPLQNYLSPSRNEQLLAHLRFKLNLKDVKELTLAFSNGTAADELGKEYPLLFADNIIHISVKPVVEWIKGDIDHDADVDMDDILLAMLHATGGITLIDKPFWAGDIDDNGHITIGDIVKIVNLAGLRNVEIKSLQHDNYRIFLNNSLAFVAVGNHFTTTTFDQPQLIERSKVTKTWLAVRFNQIYNGMGSVNYGAKIDSSLSLNQIITGLNQEQDQLTNNLVCPNPADDFIRVATDETVVKIIDIFGKESSLPNNNGLIDLTNFTTGKYWLKINQAIVPLVIFK